MKLWKLAVFFVILTVVVMAISIKAYSSKICENETIYQGVNGISDNNFKLCGEAFMITNEGEEDLDVSLYQMEINDEGISSDFQSLNQTITLEPGQMYPVYSDDANWYKFNEKQLSEAGDADSEEYQNELAKISISQHIVNDADQSLVVK